MLSLALHLRLNIWGFRWGREWEGGGKEGGGELVYSGRCEVGGRSGRCENMEGDVLK